MITEKEVTPAEVTIDGIEFTLLFKKVGNKDLSQGDGISKEPLVSIYPVENEANTYVVNVLTYVPAQRNKLTGSQKQNTLAINNTLALKYNGAITVRPNPNDREITCRDFQITYDGPENQTEFNKAHFQFQYSFGENIPSVEAIFVNDVNLDPRSSRGILITPIEPDGPGQA